MIEVNFYAVISAPVLNDKELNPRQKLLYGVITSMTGKNGWCWPTNAYLSEVIGCNKSTISLDLKQLEERGYIGTMIHLKPSGEFDYRAITPLTERAYSPSVNSGPIIQNDKDPFGNSKDPFGNSKGNKEVNIHIEKEPPIVPQRGRSREPNLDGFDEFWKTYPRKDNKATAQKAWSKLKDAERVAAFAALPIHIAHKFKDPTFIPYGATWLNQRRWEDEVEQKPSQPEPPKIRIFRISGCPYIPELANKGFLWRVLQWDCGHAHFANLNYTTPFTGNGTEPQPYTNTTPIPEDAMKALRRAVENGGEEKLSWQDYCQTFSYPGK